VSENHSSSIPFTQDRATRVATDVIRVVAESLREWVHEDLRVPRPVRREVEALLREFEDHVCQAHGERDRGRFHRRACTKQGGPEVATKTESQNT
jgi:hypothetical protein